MVNKKTMTRAKEPIKIWAKPLKNGNKALYLRRYIAHTQSKGYVYEKLDGLFLIDDKKGKDKSAKERNNQALQVASLMKCERIKEYMNEKVGIKKKAVRDMPLKDWMQTYAERKSAQGHVSSGEGGTDCIFSWNILWIGRIFGYIWIFCSQKEKKEK